MPALLTGAKVMLFTKPDALDATFTLADTQLATARTLPISVHWQRRESRDEVRLRLWHAQALLATGHPQQAREQALRALPPSRTRLGARHCFVVVLQAITAGSNQAVPSP
ncbi:MAG: hypothetical protein F9K31_09765 [Dokdonella sp.]|nr:MAG: hypothetical protein F9K31_09765 [Dokdonella sp.]